ncbi:TPA: helix-turn-helix transcriptional regulator [Candidatus Galligastranaerophilus intestinavium]|uniref:Helix-turn-helix transcriptional regulator n=1 Tax=Candidatus Galligastranaerophilus intestinavium TaxID=2840836 RepID=A0A9D1JXW7_9BACT|nr:helix-turn-helix transcriptional regulator [Candidatus Galligastranaerophilus intestinavium]
MKYQELINTSIKNLRKSNNLTQEEFAEKIDISIQGLSNIERNRYQPTADTIDKICKAFKITPAELLLGQNDNEIINNITLLLTNCPKNKLKKICEVIKILIKF